MEIQPNEIHLWWALLDVPPNQVERMAALLDADETNRVGRFLFADHRRRFVVAHGALRRLLGAYLEIEPRAVSIANEESGKPRLVDFAGSKNICFNLSHSYDLALFGFCVDGRIGVDIEHIRESTDMLKIAERFFSSEEASKIASASGERRKDLFFRYWTLKEAYLKATGEGVGGLHKMQIYEDADGIYRVRGKDGAASGQWQIRSVDMQPGYAAAVAVEGEMEKEVAVKQIPFLTPGP